MFNLVEAKQFYNENFEKISKANTCVLTGNRNLLDSGLESVLEHINNLKSKKLILIPITIELIISSSMMINNYLL